MASPANRIRRLRAAVHGRGPRELAQRLIRRAYRLSGAAELDFSLFPEDVADSTTVVIPPAVPISYQSRPLRIGWLCSPPGIGSGGHTTMFRMVEALERAGHECSVLLYDRHGSAAASHLPVIRSGWPDVRASVADARSLSGMDAYVATSWESAHVLATQSSAPGARLYFIQDYEPFFYPRGALYALAEDTYRFGFHCIALGNMVAECLLTEIGTESTLVPFGCDTSVYSLSNTGSRSGVVFYAKPGYPRRGYEVAVLGLQEFQRRSPDEEIHVYGSKGVKLPFPATHHGTLDPKSLNLLYNSSIAGLAMSFTNISLVAGELLAAGVIPIVNDSRFSRADLDHPLVAWAHPSPHGIADALSSAIKTNGRLASQIASSVPGRWEASQRAFVQAVEGIVYCKGETSI